MGFHGETGRVGFRHVIDTNTKAIENMVDPFIKHHIIKGHVHVPVVVDPVAVDVDKRAFDRRLWGRVVDGFLSHWFAVQQLYWSPQSNPGVSGCL